MTSLKQFTLESSGKNKDVEEGKGQSEDCSEIVVVISSLKPATDVDDDTTVGKEKPTIHAAKVVT